MISASQIRKSEFTRSAMGYKSNEVDEILEDAANTIDRLSKENDELSRKLNILADKIKEYRADEDNIKQALVTAQRTAETITKEAQENAEKAYSVNTEKANQIIDDAKAKAIAIIKAAEEEATKIAADTKERSAAALVEVRDKAGKMVQEVKELRSKEEQFYGEMVKKANEFRDQLLAMYSKQIEYINGLPETAAAEERDEIPNLDNLQPVEIEVPHTAVEEVDTVSDETQADVQTFFDYQEEEEPIADLTSEEVAQTAEAAPIVTEVPVVEEAPAEETNDDSDLTDNNEGFFQNFMANIPEEETSEEAQEEVNDKFADLKFGENYDVEDDTDEDDEPKRGLFHRKK